MASGINIYPFFQISGKEFLISEKVFWDIRNNIFFGYPKKNFRYPK